MFVPVLPSHVHTIPVSRCETQSAQKPRQMTDSRSHAIAITPPNVLFQSTLRMPMDTTEFEHPVSAKSCLIPEIAYRSTVNQCELFKYTHAMIDNVLNYSSYDHEAQASYGRCQQRCHNRRATIDNARFAKLKLGRVHVEQMQFLVFVDQIAHAVDHQMRIVDSIGQRFAIGAQQNLVKSSDRQPHIVFLGQTLIETNRWSADRFRKPERFNTIATHKITAFRQEDKLKGRYY